MLVALPLLMTFGGCARSRHVESLPIAPGYATAQPAPVPRVGKDLGVIAAQNRAWGEENARRLGAFSKWYACLRERISGANGAPVCTETIPK